VSLLLAGIGAAALLFVFRSKKPLTERDTVVLADFTNTTGDPVFDETLRQGLAVELEQSPFLSLVSDVRMQQTLRLMGQPDDNVLPRRSPAKSANVQEAPLSWMDRSSA
jgi:hypothetical protein